MPEMGEGFLPLLYIPDGTGRYAKLPVLTTTQRNVLTGVKGMRIFNSTTGQAEDYDGSNWVATGQVIMTTHEADLDAHTKNLFEQIRVGAYIEGLILGAPDLMALTANRLYGNPCVIPRDITVDRITLEVTSLSAGAVRMGIYQVGSADTLYPVTLLLDAGTIDCGGTGMKAITINQSLGKGLYYLAYVTDATPTLRGARAIYTPLGRQEHAFSAYSKINYYVGFSYAALPNPFTTGGASEYNIIPIISLRVSSLD